jgi:hypothetical protein
MCWIAETSTPREDSSSWAAVMSWTQSWRPGVRPVPNVTEQPEPVGVVWTLRKSSPIRLSTSTLKPSFSP